MMMAELRSVVKTWAARVGAQGNLAPLESRELYRLLARGLSSAEMLVADHPLLRRWERVGPFGKARWLETLALSFGRDDPVRQPLWQVRNCLHPPRFIGLQPAQQRHLLGQIAAEVEEYLRVTPSWYGTSIPVYRELGSSLRAVQGLGESGVREAPVLWDHVEAPQRGRLLQQIGGWAVRAAMSRRGSGLEQEAFRGLAESAGQVAVLHRCPNRDRD